MSNQWIYIKTEPALWSVGHYNPNGEFIAESDWTTPDKAAARINYLNGGTGTDRDAYRKLVQLVIDYKDTWEDSGQTRRAEKLLTELGELAKDF
jgi:hypothetical protein